MSFIDSKAKEALEEMIELQNYSDLEASHQMADDILCDMLASLGFSELADAFDQLDKWYA